MIQVFPVSDLMYSCEKKEEKNVLNEIKRGKTKPFFFSFLVPLSHYQVCGVFLCFFPSGFFQIARHINMKCTSSQFFVLCFCQKNFGATVDYINNVSSSRDTSK